jgi:hypothetical protein
VGFATEGATVKRQDVTSREYKVMLLPARFPGSDGEIVPVVEQFWNDVGALLAPIDVDTKGSFDRIKAHRRIRFFDTFDRGLNRQRYIFRERVDVDTGEREVTLKYRHPDRYVAQDRDMDSSVEKDTKTKFEEDIKPPFVSVFSYSTTAPVDRHASFAQLDHVVELFPGCSEPLGDIGPSDPIAVVREFTARELVLEGGSLLLGKHNVEAECAMVIWHDDDDPATPPVVAEFSFKYSGEDEEYHSSVARDAHDVLTLLHTGLADWAHPEPKTKTAFVYG